MQLGCVRGDSRQYFQNIYVHEVYQTMYLKYTNSSKSVTCIKNDHVQ